MTPKTILFFKEFFLATGVVWFFCAISIIIFRLNFGLGAILLTLILPLAYVIVRRFESYKPTNPDDKHKERPETRSGIEL